MRILILSQWFDPEPTFKGLAFARELVRLGHQVEVLTGFPNYPGGKLYPGYKLRFWQRDIVDGVSVVRVPLYPSHDGSGFRRSLNYLGFALTAALLGPFLVKPADVMYVYHPPATVGLPAIVIRLLRRIPFVYDIQDLWPDTLASTGMLNSRILLGCVGMWCKLVYRLASRIVVLSPGFKRALLERAVSADKVSVIYNWCDDAHFLPRQVDDATKEELGLGGKFNVIFAGTMGKAQALDSVLRAAKIVAETSPEVQFVFVGGGVEVPRLKKLVEDENIRNVLFLPRRHIHQMGEILAMADALLVHLKDDPLFAITIPSKIQAYLASGRPILLGVRGDGATLIERAGAGFLCEPESPASIASCVNKMVSLPSDAREAMGRAGNLFYKRELSLPIGVKRFTQIFREIAVSGNS